MEADKDGCVPSPPVLYFLPSRLTARTSDGKLSFEEFSAMVSNTARSSRVLPYEILTLHQDIVKQMTLEDLF
jgi:hypothetical protein